MIQRKISDTARHGTYRGTDHVQRFVSGAARTEVRTRHRGCRGIDAAQRPPPGVGTPAAASPMNLCVLCTVIGSPYVLYGECPVPPSAPRLNLCT